MRPEDKEFILGKTQEALENNQWTVGFLNTALEKEFQRFTASVYAATVSNGGAALVAILEALEIPEGGLVICPTLTAPPTPHAILAAGMRVVFVDSNAEDLGLDLEDVERKLKAFGRRIKAVIAVHVGGWLSPKIYQLVSLCKKYGAYLIEDCAHACGSRLNDRPVGLWGIAAAYSLFMTKPIAAGEGGVVTSSNKKLIEAVKIIRNYGKNKYGLHICKGFNYKLSEFNAAVALWAIKNAGYIIRERQRQAALYDELLRNLDGASIFKVPEVSCSYYKYILILNKSINRDKFKRILLQKYGVESAGGVYDVLCHQEPFFWSAKNKVLNAKEKFPAAEEFSRRQACLPLYLGLKKEEQKYVADSVRFALRSC